MEESNNNIEEAKVWLKKKGFKEAENKMSRSANTKLFGLLKSNGSKVSVTSLSCETDFVACTDIFKNYANSILTLLHEQDQVKDFEQVKMKTNNFAVDKSFDDLTVLDALKSLISKTQENCKIGIMNNFVYSKNEVIGIYLHSSPAENPNLGVKASFVVLSSDSEADLNKLPSLTELANNLAMQVVACGPKYLNKSDIPQDVIDNETKIIKERINNNPDNANISPEEFNKRLEGAVKSWYQEVALNEQTFVIQSHDSEEGKTTVKQFIEKTGKSHSIPTLKIKEYHLFV